MLEDSQNARNKQTPLGDSSSHGLNTRANLHGCHVQQVETANTMKACSQCGVTTDKPLWVREHSCPL